MAVLLVCECVCMSSWWAGWLFVECVNVWMLTCVVKVLWVAERLENQQKYSPFTIYIYNIRAALNRFFWSLKLQWKLIDDNQIIAVTGCARLGVKVCVCVCVLIVSYEGHRAALPRAQTITEPCITSQLWALGRESSRERERERNTDIHLFVFPSLAAAFFSLMLSFFLPHEGRQANQHQQFCYFLNIFYRFIYWHYCITAKLITA